MSKIFEDESDTEFGFKTDNDYAKNYDQWRKKEELNKLKTKYQNDFESSSSESDDDEEGIEITEKVEKDFFKTLACLKNKDPRIYDENVRFFDDDSTKNTVKNGTKNRKSVYLKDYERNLILEKGGILSDEEVNQADNTDQSPTYVEEQQQAKEKLKNVLNSIEDKCEGDWGGIFTKREKTAKEKEKEETDYKKWLAGQKEEIEDNQISADLKPLKEFWNDPNLDDGEKFLRDFILKKQFLDHDDEDYIPTYDEIVHDSDELSNDEEMLEKQEEFEHKYNFRFEEPDQEFIKRYPRTMENSLRKKDDKRKQKRQEIKERKKKEKEIKMQELKKLQELKKKEIEEKLEKLKELTGNTTLSFADDDIEDEFDPDKYDKRMNELFNDNFYQGTEGEQKPEFPDLDEELEIENWNHFYKDNDNDKNDNIGHCDDEDFNMDCDYDPTTITQNETIKSKKKRKRKSKFAEAVSNPKPKFDPNDKTYEEYFDEYYKLDCEDFIGDIPCRFKYRKVIPNNFGLTVEEILSAKERELNKWCSLKKAIQIRPDHVEKYDQIAYNKKAQNIALKKKILPSLFAPEVAYKSQDFSDNGNQKENTKFSTDYNTNSNQEEINNVIENESLGLVSHDKKNVKKEQKLKHNEKENVTVNDYKNTLQNVDQEEVIDNMNNNKIKKRKKKNRLKRNESVELLKGSKASQPNCVELESTKIGDEDGPPKKKSRLEFNKTSKLKKHKMKRNQKKIELPNDGQNGDSKQKLKEIKISKEKVKKEKLINDLPLAKISDERLSAYGIKKKKFKNKLKYKK